MNVLYFFTKRISFIRQLYENATGSFTERKQRIEAGWPPFEPPSWEDGEPPFVAEWIEADESLHVLAYTCVSMLAASLHLYLRTWEQLCGVPAAHDFKAEFKEGWLNGYQAYFEVVAKVRFQDSPCNLVLIEEVVLVRNRVQHPESITALLANYSNKDLRKLPQAFFIDPNQALFSDMNEGEREWLVPPTLHITKEKLGQAIQEVERFVAWLEPLLERSVYGSPDA